MSTKEVVKLNLLSQIFGRKLSKEELQTVFYNFSLEELSDELFRVGAGLAVAQLLKFHDLDIECRRELFTKFPAQQTAEFLAKHPEISAKDLCSIIQWICRQQNNLPLTTGYTRKWKLPLFTWQNELYTAIEQKFPYNFVERCQAMQALYDRARKKLAVITFCSDFENFLNSIKEKLDEHSIQQNLTKFLKEIGKFIRTEQEVDDRLNRLLTTIFTSLSTNSCLDGKLVYELMHCLPDGPEKKELVTLYEQKIDSETACEILVELVREVDSYLSADILINKSLVDNQCLLIVVEWCSNVAYKKQAAKKILAYNPILSELLQVQSYVNYFPELAERIGAKIQDFPFSQLIRDIKL